MYSPQDLPRFYPLPPTEIPNVIFVTLRDIIGYDALDPTSHRGASYTVVGGCFYRTLRRHQRHV